MDATEPVPPGDLSLVVYLASVEREITKAYDTILPALGDASKAVATTLQSHHAQYVDALSELAGSGAGGSGSLGNPTLSLVLAARLQHMSDEKSALTVASGIENQLASTYAYAFTNITSVDVAKVLATILPVVSMHTATLAALAVLPTATVFPNGPFEDTSIAGTEYSETRAGFDPAAFPVG